MEDRIKIRNNALNASQLLDSIIASPTWNQNIFTDSINLFSSEILSQSNQQKSFTVELNELSAKLQESLKSIHQELSEATGRNISLGSKMQFPSSSLGIDHERARLFDKASLQLLQSMETFKESYTLSAHGTKNSAQLNRLDQQDTIPGLGQAIKELNIAQEKLLSIIRSIYNIQESVSTLTNSALEVRQAEERLLSSLSEDSNVQATLERLTSMSITLERARQRTQP